MKKHVYREIAPGVVEKVASYVSPKTRTLLKAAALAKEPWNQPARKLGRNERIQVGDFWSHPKMGAFPMYSCVGQILADVRGDYERGTQFWTRRPKS